MTILHLKVVLAAIFIKININNRKIRPKYSQFYSLITSKCVPLPNVIYFIIGYILNDTVHISSPLCDIFKTFSLIVINYSILKELFFCGFVMNRIFPLQKLMHTPASRQPGASYAQRSP